jgi:oligopeptide/dipeptide ABC transporter ATP-binding protein
MKPDLLICDEVVSALDVSVQGQILNLLLDIRKKRDLSFLFITHDLRVACHFCDRIGVMYRGELMEEAPAAELWKNGVHPYTRLLFSSASGIAPSGELQAPALAEGGGGEEEAGCSFANRCPRASAECFKNRPVIRRGEDGHSVRCFNA